MPAEYQIFKSGKNGEHYFHLKAPNHEIILQSEGYQSKAGAENGIQSVREHSPQERYYYRETSIRGEPYFILKASNGQTIGKSEMYSSAQARDNGISSVKTNGHSAPVVDLT